MDAVEVVERCRSAARELVAGRKVVLAGNPVAGYPAMVAQLRELGARPVLIIGSGLGTGPLPGETDACWVTVESNAANPVEEFRHMERVFANPPDHIAEAVDRYDVDHDALLFVAPFQVTGQILGRSAYGGRRSEWVALEDKTVCDEVFDRAGVARPSSEVVAAADRRALVASHERLDQGDGTVWAGDARDGFNGGAVFVRWIRDAGDVDHVDEALAFFAARCDRVRVAPFLEGIPCSIHGIAADGGVAVFRPAEMVTLRTSGGIPGLRYAGVSTYFDPPAEEREVMRAAARRVGKLLADDVGFRGSFGIDGIVTADGWLPTELNPRFGAGMGTLSKGLPDFPLLLLHHMVAETGRLPVSTDDLESALVAAADGSRSGGGWTTVARSWTATEEHDVPGGTLLVGPSATGGFVRFTPDPDAVTVGESVAPLVVKAFAHADETLAAGIGPLEPARPVR